MMKQPSQKSLSKPAIQQEYSEIGTMECSIPMGGRHAQVIGLNNLDLFASFGLLSGAESFDLTPGVLEDPELNNKIDYLFVGAGTHETNPGSRHVHLHEQLEENGIDHEYYIGSEGAHDFVTWRHLLYYEFLPKLWRNE